MAKLEINIEDLFNMPGAVIYNPDSYRNTNSVVIDSRVVKKGSLFVAIKGEKFDAHDFIPQAVENGANAVVVNEKKLSKLAEMEIPVITVPDTLKAYAYLANCWRKKLSAKVISITGSNGKTTTKDMIATLLLEKYKVLKTEANNNNHIGVPLTLFSAKLKHEMIVLEHGTNHFGETQFTAEIAEPDFALITNIGDSHLEFLKDRKGVYNEKSALLDETVKSGGKILINSDDVFLKKYKKDYKNRTTFGLKNEADISGKITGITDDGRTKIEIKKSTAKFEVVLPLYGESNAKNYVAAAAVALKAGMTKKEILAGTEKLKPASKRLNVTKFKNTMLIDDTYNSNPDSMKSAVELISKIKAYSKKVFVAGDMFELGDAAKEMHISLAKDVVKSKIDLFLSLGKNMRFLSDEVKISAIECRHFAKREDLLYFIGSYNFDNSVVLFKGSRGMKMEEFADYLRERVK